VRHCRNVGMLGQNTILSEAEFVSSCLVVERNGHLEIVVQEAAESGGKRSRTRMASGNEEDEVILLHDVASGKRHLVWDLVVHVHDVILIVGDVRART